MKIHEIIDSNQEGSYWERKRPTTARQAQRLMEPKFFGDDWEDFVKYSDDGSMSYSKYNLTFDNSDMIDIDGQRVIPIRIKSVIDASLSLNGGKISSLEGLPTKSQDTMILNLVTPGLESFKFIPPGLSALNIVSMKKISIRELSENLRQCETIYLPESFIGPMLGLLRIEKLVSLSTGHKSNKAADIIVSHLRGSRDIIDCKRELISAGLGEFAKL